MNTRLLIPAAGFTVMAMLAGCESSPTGLLNSNPTAGVSVIPSAAVIKQGSTLHLELTAHDEDGQPVTPSGVTWTTSNATVANVSADGTVTGTGGGASQISAWWNGVRGGTTVTVIGEKLEPCSVGGQRPGLALEQICVR